MHPPCQAIRIGSLAIVGCPCETFTDTGLAIKEKSPFKKTKSPPNKESPFIYETFTIGLANGYNGYLPPPEQQLLGGYETWRARTSYLEIEAEPKIRAAMLEVLAKLK